MKREKTHFCSISKAVIIPALIISSIVCLLARCAGDSSPVTAFSTGGHIVYHLKPAKVKTKGRDAEIFLQHITGLECTDILSGEKIAIKDQKLQLRVPAGIFRIVDIKH